MPNFTQIRETLATFFKNSKEVSGGIGKVIPYIAILGTGVAIGGGTLTIAVLVGASAAAVEGLSGILAVIADPSNPKKKSPENEERFEVCFHLLCHQAHAQAVQDTLKKYPAVQSFEIAQEELNLDSLPDLNEANTSWEYDLDFSRIPLFDAYNARLQSLLLAAELESEKTKEIIEKVDKSARSNLPKLMSRSTEPYGWIYRYVQLAELTKTRKATDSLPSAIERAIQKATNDFLDKVKTSGPKQAWQMYREYLKELPRQEIFGSDFGIQDLYVLPYFTYYRAGGRRGFGKVIEREKEHKPLKSSLALLLSQLISTRTSRNNLIFIFGDPGIGKTSFSKTYAAALAKIPSVHPIFIPLQNIDPTADLVKEIENFLLDSPLRDAIGSLQYCSNVVFILDAFDELAQATRERMGDFFRRLERFSQDQIYRNATVIATGRHTLFSENDVLIPQNTHVITLQPFEKEQIEEWSSKWNKLTGQRFDGTKLWKDVEPHRGDLHDIATQPLLLYLLAKLEEEGERIDPDKVETSRSEVYRHIIHWCCKRQDNARSAQKEVSLSGTDMRKFLRVAGFSTMALSSRSVHISQLQGMLEQAQLATEDVQKKENYEAQQTFLSMAFRQAGQQSWEFKHKSFGEYLAAEYIGEAIGNIIAIKEDPDLPGRLQWEMKDDAVANVWIDLFARNIITPEIQIFLEPMLGDWRAFIRGEETKNREEGLRNLMERSGAMYVRFIKERDMIRLTEVANRSVIEPTRALANFGMVTLMLGSYCARSLSNENGKVYFELEKLIPDGWWKMLTGLRRYYDLSSDISRRILNGVSISRDDGITFPEEICVGIVLPYMRIGKVNLGPNEFLFLEGAILSGADLSGIELTTAFFDGGRLYEVDFSRAVLFNCSFVGASLDFANFSHADLQWSDFNNSSLSEANLEESDLSNVFFRDASLQAAVLKGANLKEADLEGAYLFQADLRNANLTGANLKDANLEGAQLEGANLEGADLTNAILKGTILEKRENTEGKSGKQD